MHPFLLEHNIPFAATLILIFVMAVCLYIMLTKGLRALAARRFEGKLLIAACLFAAGTGQISILAFLIVILLGIAVYKLYKKKWRQAGILDAHICICYNTSRM